jgi:hypothetical protein
MQTHYPGPAGTEPAPEPDVYESKLKALPPEIGSLLIIIGVAGLLLPGPVGTPFVIAGGISIWPVSFGKVDAWFHRRFPTMYRKGMTQVERFVDDLDHRYPGSARAVTRPRGV